MLWHIRPQPFVLSLEAISTLSECLFFFGIYSFHSGGLGRLYLPIFGGGNAIPFDISKKKKKEKIIHVYHK